MKQGWGELEEWRRQYQQRIHQVIKELSCPKRLKQDAYQELCCKLVCIANGIVKHPMDRRHKDKAGKPIDINEKHYIYSCLRNCLRDLLDDERKHHPNTLVNKPKKEVDITPEM